MKIMGQNSKTVGVVDECIDKLIALIPFLLGNAIFSGLKKIFKNSQTLFNEDFLVKLIQIICFELQGLRVSQVFSKTQFFLNFRNYYLTDTSGSNKEESFCYFKRKPRESSKDIQLLEEEQLKLNNQKFIKEVKERKARLN